MTADWSKTDGVGSAEMHCRRPERTRTHSLGVVQLAADTQPESLDRLGAMLVQYSTGREPGMPTTARYNCNCSHSDRGTGDSRSDKNHMMDAFAVDHIADHSCNEVWLRPQPLVQDTGKMAERHSTSNSRRQADWNTVGFGDSLYLQRVLALWMAHTQLGSIAAQVWMLVDNCCSAQGYLNRSSEFAWRPRQLRLALLTFLQLRTHRFLLRPPFDSYFQPEHWC